MRYMKKIAVVVLALALSVQSLSNSRSLAASTDNGISVQSVTTDSITTLLSIDSDGATRCKTTIIGKSNTTRIEGTMKLKKVTSSGTTTVKSWNISCNDRILIVSKTCYLLSKGTYRLDVKVKVTRNGVSETITGSHTAKY